MVTAVSQNEMHPIMVGISNMPTLMVMVILLTALRSKLTTQVILALALEL